MGPFRVLVATLRTLFASRSSLVLEKLALRQQVVGSALRGDDNRAIEITDAIRTINVLFLCFGEVPAPGFMECGLDPTRDHLDCDSYPSCP